MANYTNRHTGPRTKRQPFRRYPNPSQLEHGYEVEMVENVDPLVRAFFTICEQKALRLGDVLAATAQFNKGVPHSIVVPRNMRRGVQTNINTIRNMFRAIGYDLVLTQVGAPKVVDTYSNVPGLKTLVTPKKWPKAHPWMQEMVNIVYYHNLKFLDVWRSAGIGHCTAHFWLTGKKVPSLQNARKVLAVLGVDIAVVPYNPPPALPKPKA